MVPAFLPGQVDKPLELPTGEVTGAKVADLASLDKVIQCRNGLFDGGTVIPYVDLGVLFAIVKASRI